MIRGRFFGPLTFRARTPTLIMSVTNRAVTNLLAARGKLKSWVASANILMIVQTGTTKYTRVFARVSLCGALKKTHATSRMSSGAEYSVYLRRGGERASAKKMC